MNKYKMVKKTDFGYQTVFENEKTHLVDAVFRSVASKYDLMNDVMSFGLHRLWKKSTINAAEIRPGQTVLDVASGTGDLAQSLIKQIGQEGHVVVTDINDAMLTLGRKRLEERGHFENISYVLADAEQLPFQSHTFDCITIAFGLRNVTDKNKALASFYRVLKPGGKLIVLEFSSPRTPLISKLYDLYSFNVIPKIGELITKDKASYQYLVESIRKHPDQETLKQMMCNTQFEDVTYQNFNDGIVALHKGYKY